jgi:tRNA modification GTPase
MLRPYDDHPIAALASGSGPGAVGVIRVSGVGAFELVTGCASVSIAEIKPRYARLANILDPSTKEVIDEVILMLFRGPRSFTGQDTVEIHCHGGPYIIQRILSTIYSLGARPAQPGEFTKRALLNGKLDMTAAEGLRDLIESQSRQQWLAGRQLYQGKLKTQVESLRTEVVGGMALLEAMIDFPDEGDTQSVRLSHVKDKAANVAAMIDRLLSTFTSGKVASRGLMVALVGAPNAGKSTLLNSLLGRPRAIVSDQAGTTRDYIEESCLLDGRLLRLIDTAGLRDTDDHIERQGISLSKQMMAEADLVLCLITSDSNEKDRDEILRQISLLGKPSIITMTKSDISKPRWSDDLTTISCLTGEGLAELKQKLINIVDQATGSIEEQPFITSARQAAALQRAQESLKRFSAALESAAGHEMLAFELQEATRALASIVGDISSEDVLDKIFSEFCIGK